MTAWAVGIVADRGRDGPCVMAWLRVAGGGICNRASARGAPSPLRGDDCVDAGGRAMQGAIAEGWGEGQVVLAALPVL